MRLFGYARVSTSLQSLEIQKKTLKEAGVQDSRIFSDTGSNTDRKGINTLLVKVEEGDLILITRLDRLGRNTLDTINIIEQLDRMKVGISFLKEGISTEGAMGRMIITILSAVAEAERTRILERTNEGRLEAKSRGIKFGRKSSIDYGKVIELKNMGLGCTEIGRRLGISRTSVYNTMKLYNNLGQNTNINLIG